LYLHKLTKLRNQCLISYMGLFQDDAWQDSVCFKTRKLIEIKQYVLIIWSALFYLLNKKSVFASILWDIHLILEVILDV
jgi:hypothetical protein